MEEKKRKNFEGEKKISFLFSFFYLFSPSFLHLHAKKAQHKKKTPDPSAPPLAKDAKKCAHTES